MQIYKNQSRKKKHICIKEKDKERKGSKKYIKSDKGNKGIRD